jgi:homoserine/homoserine lactone efflux protein
MDMHIYLAFVAATTIMILLPGPSVLLTVSHSISFGWQRAIATVAGETMGIAIQLAVASIGMASLLNGIAEVFELLRWFGAAYLVYIGVKQWRSASIPMELNGVPASKSNLFVQGLVVTTFNPKSLVFIAAFLPQFIDTRLPIDLQLACIVPTFLAITFIATSGWALLAGNVRGFLKNQRAFQTVSRTAGGMLVMAGVGLAMARRGN